MITFHNKAMNKPSQIIIEKPNKRPTGLNGDHLNIKDCTDFLPEELVFENQQPIIE